MNSEIFKKELSCIEDENIRKFTETALNNLPQYFFEVAASSTGKYHPTYALGDGGLVRHTKAAVRFACHLLTIEQNKKEFDLIERSCIISAILLHDGWKHGDKGSAFTTHEHPVVCGDWLRKSNCLSGIISEDVCAIIASAVESHMGEWNESKRSNTILPKPETNIQKFVHMCDYLASRKDIEVLFDADESATVAKPEVKIEDYKFTFGKHKGELITEVAKNHKDYLEWMRDNMSLQEPLKTFVHTLLS